MFIQVDVGNPRYSEVQVVVIEMTSMFNLFFNYDCLRTKEGTMENANQDNASTIPGVICPQCGSTKLIFSVLQFLAGPPYQLTCKDCNCTWKHETKISFTQPDKLNLFLRLVEKIWK